MVGPWERPKLREESKAVPILCLASVILANDLGARIMTSKLDEQANAKVREGEATQGKSGDCARLATPARDWSPLGFSALQIPWRPGRMNQQRACNWILAHLCTPLQAELSYSYFLRNASSIQDAPAPRVSACMRMGGSGEREHVFSHHAPWIPPRSCSQRRRFRLRRSASSSMRRKGRAPCGTKQGRSRRSA
jgi:hypothetical protein